MLAFDVKDRLSSLSTAPAILLYVLTAFACTTLAGQPEEAALAFSVVAAVQNKKALARAHDVEVQGDLMVVPGKGGSLAILDVSDPANPRLIGSKDLSDDAQTVLCRDGHVLVGARDFYAVDISEPQAPKIRERLHDRPRIDRINGMIAWGDNVLYANKAGWIGSINISNPAEPVPAGALNTKEHGDILSPHDIAAYKDYVITVDQRDESPLKVRLYRVADTTTGHLLSPDQWSAAGAVDGEQLNGANRVDVYGDYALIACNKANTLAVIDISNPEKPATVKVMPFPGEPCGLTVSGAVLFAAGGQSVQAIDLTDPNDPSLLATFESEEAFPSTFATTPDGEKQYTTIDGERQPTRGNAHDLVYKDGYLYVTAQSDDQVAILKVRDRNIRMLAEQPPPRLSGSCIPVNVEDPETMTKQRRVRPQALLFGENNSLAKLLYSTDGSDGVSIASGLAETTDGGSTWTDHPANPVLNRIESDWQGRRAFATALTRDEENERWVMASVGDDTTPDTPGKRAVGLWFSDDLVHWEQYKNNPIITVETDNALRNDDILPGPDDPPVGMYLRDLCKIDGQWYALVQWRGEGTWSRMTVMQSKGDVTGPWRFRNVCLNPAVASDWFRTNRNLNWCQPVKVAGRWYAACQNGVAESDRNNTQIGIVYSDDYFHWHEFDNPVTAPLTRPDGSPVVSSQQFLLPPEDGKPWRILLGARGLQGRERYMYLVSPHRKDH